jgi:isocitrate/isopropylmalate dehydrogenase
MLTTLSVTVVKCDGCGKEIISGLPSARFFLKDLCANCACDILTNISSTGLITEQEFDEILDDYQASHFRAPDNVIFTSLTHKG